MSYQAYLDAIEAKSSETPRELLDLAADRGFGRTTQAGEVVTWLHEEYGVGRGHAMAFHGVPKRGPTISDAHVGSGGSRSDPSTELQLDGIAARGGHGCH